MQIAEVVASNIKYIKAQILGTHQAPEFGLRVQVQHSDGTAILALVYQVEAESIEPNRQVEAYNMSRETLQREMPQVFELIRTYISAIVLTYHEYSVNICQIFSKLHNFTAPCNRATIQQLAGSFGYLRTILNSKDADVPIDELLVAVLENAKKAFDLPNDARNVLIQAGTHPQPATWRRSRKA
ncbi:MAG TPA: hypothetical protein PLO56_06195 [Rhodothermales bacterium]|nr:hypothetical protein [Rhodothermales bacterium]